MNFLLFLLVAMISFAGSIHVGAVSLAVVQTTISRNLWSGIWVAIGGSIPEFIYAFFALEGLLYLQENQPVLDALNISIIPIFLILGIIYFFQKDQELLLNTQQPNRNKLVFFKGFSLGMLNPQLLPFWFFTLVYLSKYFIINDLSSKTAFVLGTGIGAFIILFIFAHLAHRFQTSINKFLKRYSANRIMGYIFISMAMMQAIKIFI